MSRSFSLFVLAGTLSTLAQAHNVEQRRDNAHSDLRRRQLPPYPSGPGYDIPPLESIVPLPAGYSENVLPVPTTFTPGSTPTALPGAPPLPAATINVASYPPTDEIPPIDSPEVKQWISEIDWSTIPNIPPNYSRVCSDTQNAAAIANGGPNGSCWWTCTVCTRDVDITTCAAKGDYGHGYDDGPGLYSPKLTAFLESRGLKATFFIVGSRVVYNPQMLQYEHITGHELSVHTFSHGGSKLLGLTSMSNEQIVAEFGWTKKLIKDVTGVTPLTFRPPFGDIDDRVRAIALAMGLQPIIWTSKSFTEIWDSQDWVVHGGGVQAVPNQAHFQSILDDSFTEFPDHGIIALQHDIYVESVNLAIGYTLPFVLGPRPNNNNQPFNVKPVMQCQGRTLADAYNETTTNKNNPVFDSSVDVAKRKSNLGYAAAHPSADAVTLTSRSYVSPPHATQTQTGTGSGGGGATSTRGSSSSSTTTPSGAVGLRSGVSALIVGFVGVVVGLWI